MEIFSKKVIDFKNDDWKEIVIKAIEDLKNNYEQNKESLKNCEIVTTTQLGKELKTEMSAQALNKFLIDKHILKSYAKSNYVLEEDFRKYGVQLLTTGVSIEDDMLVLHKSSSVKWNLDSGIVELINSMLEKK